MNLSTQPSEDQADRPKAYPYIVFGSLAIVLFVVSGLLVLLKQFLFAQIAVSIGASISTVLIVAYIWRYFGGEPVLKAALSLRKAIRQLAELDTAGIIGVKCPRRDFFELTPNRLILCQLLRKAKEVDMMALTLERQVSAHPEVVNSLTQAIWNNHCQLRMVTLCPIGDPQQLHPLTRQRIQEEDKTGRTGARSRFQGALKQTWDTFTKMQQEYANDPDYKDCLQLRWTDEITIYVNIWRIDDRMGVSPYLSSGTGGTSPLFELSGREKVLFKRFREEFEHVFRNAQPVPPSLLPAAAPE